MPQRQGSHVQFSQLHDGFVHDFEDSPQLQFSPHVQSTHSQFGLAHLVSVVMVSSSERFAAPDRIGAPHATTERRQEPVATGIAARS